MEKSVGIHEKNKDEEKAVIKEMKKMTDSREEEEEEKEVEEDANLSANSNSSNYSSNWARSLSGQLDDNAKKMEVIEKEKAKKTDDKPLKKKKTDIKGMTALRKWFGDDPSENEVSSSDSEN